MPHYISLRTILILPFNLRLSFSKSTKLRIIALRILRVTFKSTDSSDECLLSVVLRFWHRANWQLCRVVDTLFLSYSFRGQKRQTVNASGWVVVVINCHYSPKIHSIFSNILFLYDQSGPVFAPVPPKIHTALLPILATSIILFRTSQFLTYLRRSLPKFYQNYSQVLLSHFLHFFQAT